MLQKYVRCRFSEQVKKGPFLFCSLSLLRKLVISFLVNFTRGARQILFEKGFTEIEVFSGGARNGRRRYALVSASRERAAHSTTREEKSPRAPQSCRNNYELSRSLFVLPTGTLRRLVPNIPGPPKFLSSVKTPDVKPSAGSQNIDVPPSKSTVCRRSPSHYFSRP